MVIDMQDTHKLVNDGSFGRVVLDKKNNIVIKIFNNKEENEITQKVFENEIEAYKIAMKSKSLINFVPKFYDKVKISKIINKLGRDISNLYHLDYAFKMEFIKGKFEKLNSSNYSDKDEIIKKFKDEGINYIEDSSICIDNNQIKIIDFSIEETNLFHEY